MVVVDEAGRHAMEAADKSKNEGKEAVSTTVLDPLEVGGVKAASGTNKPRPHPNVGIVARKATERVSAERSALILTNLDRAGVTETCVRDCTMPRAQEEPKMDWSWPL